MPLIQAFERWDGKGVPGKVGHDELAPAIRLVHLADNIEAFHHSGGPEAAVEVATSRRGTQFDPELVDRFCADPDVILDGLGSFQAWDQVIDLDPRLGRAPHRTAARRGPRRAGRLRRSQVPVPARSLPRGGRAGRGGRDGRWGCRTRTSANLRRAGAIHDIGMVGMPSGVWDATEPWTLAQSERARTHPYLTERMFAHVASLKPIVACASQHHERLDGSGYPHGMSGTVALPLGPAPGRGRRLPRPARSSPASCRARRRPPRCRRCAARSQGGRLDPAAVDAVLRAAGPPGRRGELRCRRA